MTIYDGIIESENDRNPYVFYGKIEMISSPQIEITTINLDNSSYTHENASKFIKNIKKDYKNLTFNPFKQQIIALFNNFCENPSLKDEIFSEKDKKTACKSLFAFLNKTKSALILSKMGLNLTGCDVISAQFMSEL